MLTNEEEEEEDLMDDLGSVTARSEVGGGSSRMRSGVGGGRQMALRRKRSLSVADIPVPAGFEDNKQQIQKPGPSAGNRRRSVKAEESGTKLAD